MDRPPGAAAFSTSTPTTEFKIPPFFRSTNPGPSQIGILFPFPGTGCPSHLCRDSYCSTKIDGQTSSTPHVGQTMRIKLVLLSFKLCARQISYSSLRCLQAMISRSQSEGPEGIAVGRAQLRAGISITAGAAAAKRSGRFLALGRQEPRRKASRAVPGANQTVEAASPEA